MGQAGTADQNGEPFTLICQQVSRTGEPSLACPAPVLMTKAAVEKDGSDAVTVVVDNPAALENVTRFLESQGFSANSVPKGNDFRISAQRRDDGLQVDPKTETAPSLDPERKHKIMVMLSTDRLGYGDDELGKKLVASFIKTLEEMGPELWRLVLVNNGVKLAGEGSPDLESLPT